MATSASTPDEDMAEGASTADEAVAKGMSMMDEAMAMVESTARRGRGEGRVHDLVPTNFRQVLRSSLLLIAILGNVPS